jgi:Right handed beta helix region
MALGFYGRPAQATVAVSVFVTAFALSAEPAAAATRVVNAGGDLQATLNAAVPGDEIVLQAGARFVGPFVLPQKPAGNVITIRSSATLPDRRITPSDSALLPTLASSVISAILDASNAVNWKLDGIQFESVLNGQGEVIVLQNSLNIYMDRLLIVAGQYGQKRGIRGNGRYITLTRSHIANIWREGQDSQTFCAWDGAGPYTITGNYLEAASENVMFGGADSASPDRVPADILVEGNYFSKRLEWKGQPKAVKNLFELKSAKRVTVRGNVFEHNWTDAQNGFAILLKSVNQDGTAPWSATEDVIFENNIVRDTENGVNIMGNDYAQPSGRTTRLTLRNNLFIATGVAFQLGGEIGDLTMDHNTVDQGYTLMSLYDGAVWNAGAPGPRAATYAVERLTFTNTLARHNDYGVKGDGAAVGTPSLVAFTSSFTWTMNVLAGGAGWPYPAVTLFPTVPEYQAQFEADYTLVAGSPYRNAGTDGKDLGFNWIASVPWPPKSPRNVRITTGL